METAGFPRISVCITSLNRAPTLEKTLRLLLAQDYPPGRLRLLLRDDGSSDGTAGVMNALAGEFRAKGFAAAEVSVNSGTPNLVAARNFLAAAARPSSDMILVMDDDVYLEPDSLRLLAERFVKENNCGVLAPRSVFEADRSRTAGTANFVNRFSGTYRGEEPSVLKECDWVSSCCVLISMDAWERAGGLCGAFVTMHEEADLCLRVRSAGFRVLYCPEVVVRHDVDIGLQRRHRAYYNYRNKAWVIRRNFRFPELLTALLVYLLLGMPKSLFESVSYHRSIAAVEIREILRGFRDGIFGSWR